MQSKWILQTLMRIFAASKYDVAIACLQAFLPLSMKHFQAAVLSPALASALTIWHGLAHSLQKSYKMDNLEDVLQTASKVLHSAVLHQYHRPYARLSSMTFYKRFLQDCHQRVVDEKLDREAVDKAKQLEEIVAQVSEHVSTLKSEEACNFDFDKVLVMLKDNLSITAVAHLFTHLWSTFNLNLNG